ncbi:pentapeptide repeat-containing protein [Halegenticoccus soli]|uniref:pentapeptide repeat-containing protein n=1 Tax=Halegenticoccus soli TaxID=1985678 RepID=UPI000C6D8D2B|nr:pentapeptide repeat-containing protein [Halegenticoccus soli]
MSDGRCEYEQDVHEVDGLGPACCWREVWGDRERCVWHADESDKPREALERDRPDRGERIDGAVLRGSPLSGVDWFAGRTLAKADFAGSVLRESDFSDADLRHAKFEDGDVSRVTFERANLEDAMFVRTDVRGTNFENAKLYRTYFFDARMDNETAFGDRIVYERALADADTNEEMVAVGDAATWTYRGIQRVLDENALTRRERRYYVREKDVLRRVSWAREQYGHALMLEASRWVMLYGVSPFRVLASSALVILVSAVLYPLTGGLQEPGAGSAILYPIETLDERTPGRLAYAFFLSLYFSVITFTTLGYGDVQPLGLAARAVASAESLLGTLLIALLVFTLTRSIR